MSSVAKEITEKVGVTYRLVIQNTCTFVNCIVNLYKYIYIIQETIEFVKGFFKKI